MDIVAVGTACAVECKRQMVGLPELGFLLEAYNWLYNYTDRVTVETFEILGSFVEPGKNRNGFRRVPVTFANGGSSANASDIPRLMISLRDGIADLGQFGVNEIVRQFLWIHPFADGNGRVGFLLYNYLQGTLDSPLALPDYNW